MEPPLIGNPQRLAPFQSFLGTIAKASEPILISGPTGSGKKRVIQFLLENGSLHQSPVFSIPGFCFSEDLWSKGYRVLNNRGTLAVEGIQYLPEPLQARFKDWLSGQGPLFSEPAGIFPDWRVIVTSSNTDDIWEDLRYAFPFHIQLPSLNEVIDDIPYHLKYFLREKSIRYVRYFFLLKTFFHQWGGNLRELEHYLTQAMAYYYSLALSGGEAVFGEKKLRYYEDVLRGEWWYYPYRFTPEFTKGLKDILIKTDFRSKIIEEQLVISLLKEEPGFLVLDLMAPDFEEKAIRIYHLFLNYLQTQPEKDL
jgi:hypothetical protein